MITNTGAGTQTRLTLGIYDAPDSGKQAHYMFCWLNSAGERGPWKMASATITSELQSITN